MKIHHAIFAFFFVTGCMFQQPDYLKVITATELHSILQQQNVFLLDVHIPEQHHIKGTDAFIPFNDIELNFRHSVVSAAPARPQNEGAA
jgi:hypothetical protein